MYWPTHIHRWWNMKKKTHDQFLEEIKITNPSILVLGNYVNCSTKIEVKCLKCNHIWNTVPNSLSQGHGCPICARNQKKSHQQFVLEMYGLNPYIEILGEYKTAHNPLAVRCTICNHEWSAKPSRLLNGAQCTNCTKPHTSFMEQFIFLAFQEALGADHVESRNIDAIGLELDIFIPRYKLAIEPGTWLSLHMTYKSEMNAQKMESGSLQYTIHILRTLRHHMKLIAMCLKVF